MKIFDIILFISLLSIAAVQFAFDLIGLYGLIALVAIAFIGLMPTRFLFTKKSPVKLMLQRISGKTQR
jgi:hypothetical protein